MAKIKFCSGTQAQVAVAPITNGTLYVATDTGNISVDLNSKRIPLTEKYSAITDEKIKELLNNTMPAS